MILFKDIYSRAINLFDDPDISEAYAHDAVRFGKMMYPHLINGIPLFKNPTAITWELLSQTAPEGQMEIFTADEVIDGVVTLSTTPAANSDVVCKINNRIDPGAVYNSTTSTVTLSREVASDAEVSVEWYYGGQFNTDFSTAVTPKISATVISSRVIDILARALVVAWAEKNKNFLIEIRNNLRDSDFDFYSPANSITSKVTWVKDLRRDLDTMQTKLGWDLYSVYHNSRGYYGC